MLEMEENKKFQETTYKKMIIYRDRLIEHGLYNFDDEFVTPPPGTVTNMTQ